MGHVQNPQDPVNHGEPQGYESVDGTDGKSVYGMFKKKLHILPLSSSQASVIP
jgi:hypothetical protein